MPITGQDAGLAAARRITEGTQGMTVYKDTRELVKVAVETAVKMAKGKEPDVKSKVNNDKIDVPEQINYSRYADFSILSIVMEGLNNTAIFDKIYSWSS